MNNLIWAIGIEVTLSVLGFTDIDRPTVGGMTVPARHFGQRIYRPAQPP
jgi:hypothetical protein